MPLLAPITPTDDDVDRQLEDWAAARMQAETLGYGSGISVPEIAKLEMWAHMLDVLPEVTRQAAGEAAIMASLKLFRRNLIRDMGEEKAGVKWPHLRYRSSSPSEVPRTQTRAFINSLNLVIEGPISNGVRGYIESRDPAAAPLEFGTSKMLPRAPFRRTYARYQADIMKKGRLAAMRVIRAAIKAGAGK